MRFTGNLNGASRISFSRITELKSGSILLLSAFCAMAGTDAAKSGLALPGAVSPVSRAQAAIRSTLAELPLVFEPNRGQADPQVSFLARAGGYTLYLTRREAVVAFGGSAPIRVHPSCAQEAQAIEGVEPTGGISNYFIGNDRARWTTRVPNYRKVQYTGVCPGVDVTYYGNPQKLEYDLTLAAWTNPSTVQMEYEGAESVRVAANGDLIVKTAAGELVQHKPFAYQIVGGRQRQVEAGYRVIQGKRVEFALSQYDRKQALIIDPVLVYSTYLGGSGGDSGASIAVDASGNAYVTGQTSSTNFPIANAVQPTKGASSDAFVTKISADGSTKLYSTYLGGNNTDVGLGIAVDTAGNAYVTGQTGSSNFPTVSALQGVYNGGFDAFVTKLNPSGSALLYSTYLGGTQLDQPSGIAADASGNAYVSGFTTSTNFPTTGGAFQTALPGIEDGFVTKLNAAGALAYSTYLGGSSVDQALGIAVDSSGNAYVTGTANSTNFPVIGGSFQTVKPGSTSAFVTKLNSTGSAMLFSTYLGGSGNDHGSGIAVDGAGDSYVTGSTNSTNFPTTASPIQGANGGGLTDAFVTKLNPTGTALIYSSYLGGSGTDVGSAIAVSSGGTAYVVGTTNSANFPTQSALFTTGSVFVTAVNPSGALSYSTYLTGSASDQGSGVAAGLGGSAYVTGFTASLSFPTQNPLQATLGGSSGNAFVTKIASAVLPFDFNGDGRNDVMWQDPATGLVQIWFMGGALGTTVTGAANVTSSNPWKVVGTGDFNQDGHPDLVWQDPVTGSVQIWFLGGAQGTTLTGAVNLTGANSWRIVGVADFNSDGHPDILWQDPVTGLAQIWFLSGAQGNTLTGAVNLTNGNTWRIAGTGDFNQDGHPDVVWQDPATGATQVWFLGGAQGNVVTSAVNLLGPNSWRIPAVLDFDLDGHPDIIFQDPASGAAQIWLLGGSQGTTVTGVFALSGGNSWRIVGPR